MKRFERALRAWVEAAVALLAAGPDGYVEEISGWLESRWEAIDENQFALREHSTLGWSRPFLEAIQALPSFEEVRAAAEAEPVVRSQVGAVVGTVLARHQLSLEALAASVLPSPILVDGSSMISTDETFEERWARLREFLFADSVELTAFYPLAGVVVEEPPLALEEGLLLDRMDAVELDVGLRFGIIPRAFVHVPSTTLESSKRFCLRYRYRLSKVVGDGDVNDAAAEAQAIFDRLDGIARDFLDAAALVGPARLGVLGIVEHEAVQMYGHGTRWRAIAEQQLLRFGGEALVIGASQAERLKVYWSRLRADGFHDRNRGLSLALRRFAGHRLRKELDDQVLDLMIAAEALYLSDLGNEQVPGRAAESFGAPWSHLDRASEDWTLPARRVPADAVCIRREKCRRSRREAEAKGHQAPRREG